MQKLSRPDVAEHPKEAPNKGSQYATAEYDLKFLWRQTLAEGMGSHGHSILVIIE